MTKKERTATARIFTDLIKADRIIDEGEMQCWENLCRENRYNITPEIACEAQKMSFADAISAIVNSESRELKRDLLGDCRSMTVSDGFCANSEALIMIALIMALGGDDDSPEVEVYSIPKADFNIDIATAVYIETDEDEEINEAIAGNYRLLFKELQLAGFHFVYLPNIIKHYRDTDAQLFRSILKFLAPEKNDDAIDSAYKSLIGMTTPTFTRDLLVNRCHIDSLRDTYPSLLIKIGNSFVGDTPYANYLKIEVGEDIVATVQEFVDRFCGMLSSDVYVVNSSEERDSQFHFHGFYKQLLDIFLKSKDVKSKIVIDRYIQEILFADIEKKAESITRREKALYILLLCRGSRGLDFAPPKGEAMMANYKKRMAKIQRQYTEIYAMLGGDRSQTPDIIDGESRRPMVSRIRKSIKEISGLYHPGDYTVTSPRRSVLKIDLDPSLVYVKDLHGNDHPLAESDIYHRVKDV